MFGALGRVARRLQHALNRRRFEADLEDELEFHLESRARDLEAAGLSPEQALRHARLRLGRDVAVREAARDIWLIRWVDDAWRDLRIAVRGLRRSPGFTAVAVLSLGLGIGGNAALASLLDAALFKPLPYPDPDRIVSLTLRSASEEGESAAARFPWSYPKFEVLDREAAAFEAIVGMNTTNLNVGSGREAERVFAEEVSSGYFELLGVRPVLGRLFDPRVDSVPGGTGVVLLGHGLWLRRFGGDSAIVGRSILVHGQPLVVSGVLPRGFGGVSLAAEVWVPLTAATVFEYPEILDEAGNHWLDVIARLRPGISLPAAQQDVDRFVDVLNAAWPGAETTDWSTRVAPLEENRIDPGVRRAVVVLFVAVALVLLIASVNLVNLFLARTAGRQRELAVRLAVGAGSRHLIRHLTAESVVLAAVGGVVGFGLATLTLPLLLAMAPDASGGPTDARALIDIRNATIDVRVAIFTSVVALLTGLLVAIAPARRAARANVADAFRRGEGWRRQRAGATLGAQRLLVAFEIALALMLLAGAGLLVKSLVRLQALDLGFESRNVLTFRASPADDDVAARDPIGFRIRLLDELRQLPGVVDAAAGCGIPLAGHCMRSVVRLAAAPQDRIQIGVHHVTPRYMQTLGIALKEGRLFDDSDRRGSPRVAIVSETAARRIWPGQSPLGKELAVFTAYFHGGDSAATVVGVVSDVSYGAPGMAAGPQVYVPALQMSFGFGTYLVKAESEPLVLERMVRDAVRRVDPGLPIYDVRTMDERATIATARPRFATFVLLVFAALGVTLAAVGVYGVMAYAVANRTRELGIRLALGADAARVRRMVLGEALRTAVAGLGVGAVGALAVTRLLTSMLYQVDPRDPGVLAPAALVLLGIAALAAYLPARRAAATDPMRSIRVD